MRAEISVHLEVNEWKWKVELPREARQKLDASWNWGELKFRLAISLSPTNLSDGWNEFQFPMPLEERGSFNADERTPDGQLPEPLAQLPSVLEGIGKL